MPNQVAKWAAAPGLFLTVGRLRELLDEVPDDWTVACVRSGKLRPVEAVRLHQATHQVSFDYLADFRAMDIGGEEGEAP